MFVSASAKRAVSEVAMAAPRLVFAKHKTGSRSAQARASAKNAWLCVISLVAMCVPQGALLWRPVVGIYAVAAALVCLLVLALASEAVRKLAVSAAILPTALLVSLCVPGVDAFIRTGVFYNTILLLVLFYDFFFARQDPLSIVKPNKGDFMLLPLIILIGQVLGVIGYGLLRHSYPFYGVPLPLVGAMAIVFAVAEEAYFRGLLQQESGKLLHPLVAAGMVTGTYVVAGAGHGSWLPISFAAISGGVLSGIYYYKRNTILTTAANAAMKLTYLGLLLAFVVH